MPLLYFFFLVAGGGAKKSCNKERDFFLTIFCWISVAAMIYDRKSSLSSLFFFGFFSVGEKKGGKLKVLASP